MQAIEITKLTKNFKNTKAVDDISFSVVEGEIFGLLGPNGAGKTTIIKMLTTLLKPTSGEAKVWGNDVIRQRDEVRNCMGIVFQEPALDNNLTGYENLDFHTRLYGLKKELREKRITEVLDLVELQDKANVLVKNYSGGMQRRLEIARGLMHYPKVLFLDEPTLGLDTQTRRHIWEYILMLNRKEKTTIILTTHYMEEADYLCQRVAIIDFGKIIIQDTPKNLKDLLGGDVISIEVTQPEKAMISMKDMPWIKKISRHNDIIDLNVEQGETKIPLLVKIDQEQAGFSIKSISLRKPTLEDVFLNFTGKTIRESETNQNFGNKGMARRHHQG